MIIYEGPSLIDGAPIVAIATGLAQTSNNRKTGDMIQTWILRSDMAPLEAVKNGGDTSICGDCRHRGVEGKHRSCYVNVGQAPGSIFRAYKRGSYPRDLVLDDFADRRVRLGAYGDPAAVPYEILQSIVAVSSGHTGYTHAWRRCDPRLRELCMASCDSVEEHQAAAAAGWRVFRTRLPEQRADARLDGESLCPASDEAGHKLTCETCLACGGTGAGRRGHIVLAAHGSAGVVQSYRRTFKGIEIAA